VDSVAGVVDDGNWQIKPDLRRLALRAEAAQHQAW